MLGRDGGVRSGRGWAFRLDCGDDGADEGLEDPDVFRTGMPPPSSDGHRRLRQVQGLVQARQAGLFPWGASSLAVLESVLPDDKEAVFPGRPALIRRLLVGTGQRGQKADFAGAHQVSPARADAKTAAALRKDAVTP